MDFNKQAFKEFRKDFAKAMKPLEQKYDIQAQIGNITYNPSEFRTKLTCIKTSDVKTEKEEFEHLCERYGFQHDDYLTEFFIGRTKYVLIGFNPKARKNVCVIKQINTGGQYVATAESVKHAIALNA